jgi:hypothetical protein
VFYLNMFRGMYISPFMEVQEERVGSCSEVSSIIRQLCTGRDADSGRFGFLGLA